MVQAVVGKKKKGLRALIKSVSPNAQWTHCVKRREAPAARQMSPGLKEVLTDVISVISFIQNRPLKVRLLCAPCEEMGAERFAVLLHSEALWPRELNCYCECLSADKKTQVFLEGRA